MEASLDQDNINIPQCKQWLRHRSCCTMQLLTLLYEEAQAKYGASGCIQFHWDHAVESLDVAAKSATFSRKDGTTVEAAYGLLCAADGAHSRVRKALESQVRTISGELAQRLQLGVPAASSHLLQALISGCSGSSGSKPCFKGT